MASPVRPTKPIVWPVVTASPLLDEGWVAQVHVDVVGGAVGGADDDVVARQRLAAGELHRAGLRRDERKAAVGHDVLALVHVAAALRAEALTVGVRPGDREDVVHEPEALAPRRRRAAPAPHARPRRRRSRPPPGRRSGRRAAPRRRSCRPSPRSARCRAPWPARRSGRRPRGRWRAPRRRRRRPARRRGRRRPRSPSGRPRRAACASAPWPRPPARRGRACRSGRTTRRICERSDRRPAAETTRTRPPCALAGHRGLDRRGRHRGGRDGHVVAVAAAAEQDDARHRRHPLAADAHDASRRGAGDAQAPGPAGDRVDDGSRAPAAARRGRARAPARGGAAGPRGRLSERGARHQGGERECGDDDPPLGSGQGYGGARGQVHGSVGRLRGELTGSRGRSALPGIPPGFAPGARERAPVGPPLCRRPVGDRQTRRIYWWWRGILYPPTDVRMPTFGRTAETPPQLPYHAPSRRADRPPRGSFTLS